MSNADQALARVNHQEQVARTGKSAPQTIEEMLRHPGMQKQMQMALPRGMSADRILRIAMTALRQTPKLAACTPGSFIGALFQSAQLGLEPSNGLGYAYLIPYGHEVTFVVGYKGLLELARRSGEISELYAYPVYSADHFNYTLGLNRTVDHQPAVDGEPTDKDMVAVYAVAKFKDGGEDFEVMTRGQVDAIRKRSKASGNGPWVTDYAEMARKTVLKRLCKRLPLAIETQSAIAADETIKTTLAADMTQVPDVSQGPDVFAGQVIDAQTGEVLEAEAVDAPEDHAEGQESAPEVEVVSGEVIGEAEYTAMLSEVARVGISLSSVAKNVAAKAGYQGELPDMPLKVWESLMAGLAAMPTKNPPTPPSNEPTTATPEASAGAAAPEVVPGTVEAPSDADPAAFWPEEGAPHVDAPESDDAEVPGRGALFSADDPSRPASSTEKRLLSKAIAKLPTAWTKEYRKRFGGRGNSELTHGEIAEFIEAAVKEATA